MSGRLATVTDERLDRLRRIGVSHATAVSLFSDHPSRRIVDALDALEELGEGAVRSPAGWVVSAVREKWDLRDLLTDRRAAEARHARWERERARRDRADARWTARENVASRWRAAISAALDDDVFAVAVERATSPVAGLERRSVPIARAQLLAWAVAVHDDQPGSPLVETLRADLETGPSPASDLAAELPPPPAGVETADDLGQRLTDLLVRRPDLAHVASRTHRAVAPSRHRGELGAGHVR